MSIVLKHTRPVASLLQDLVAGVGQSYRRRAAIRELSALPDWQLLDIGIFRGDITRVVDQKLAEKRAAEAKPAAVAAKTDTIGDNSYVANTSAAA